MKKHTAGRPLRTTRLPAAATALLALAAVMLSACKKEAAGSAAVFSPRYGPDRQETLYIAGHYTNFEALEAEFDRFKEFYPEVDIRYEHLDKYNETILPAIRSDLPPDIYFTFTWMLDKDDYRPLFDKAENLAAPQLGIDYSCILEGSVIQGKGSGRVAMLPILSTSFGMLVNEDLFKRLGLDIPTDYGELKATCARLKAEGFTSPIIGYDEVERSPYACLLTPYFCELVHGNAEAVQKLNALEAGSGAYLEAVFDLAEDFAKSGATDREIWGELKSIDDLIFRFFEGDIPIVFCNGDTVSSTKKRERISEAFMAAPFSYGFYPIPTDRGRIFLKMTSIDISVNKNSRKLDMANEFVRFLISSEELNGLAKHKRLITVTDDYDFDDVYSAFADADISLNYDDIGIMDNPIVQMRKAVMAVANGEMSKETAMATFGSF